MSTPPGPYGQQPPYGQNPYGQQPYPQPQPYQQAPYNPYGPPQQGSWGTQPPLAGLPPLPPQRNTGKVLAVVIGAIAFFALGGAGLLVALGSAGNDPKPQYKLSVPTSLENGKYPLTKDISQDADSSLDGARSGYGVRNVTGVGGAYKSGTDGLVFDGLYGTVYDPDMARDHLLHGVEDAKDTTSVAVPAKVITPTGSSESLKCEVLNAQAGVRTVPAPLCVWADNGTVAAVMKMSPSNLTASADSIDLNAFADEVNTIRGEVRVPLG